MYNRLAAALFCLVLALTFTGCYPAMDVGPTELPVRTVEVIELQRVSAEESVRLIGRIEPWRETTLYFEVAGVVESVMVEEGDVVEAGQSIARLIVVDYQLGAAQAIARRDATRAQLDLLLAGTRQEDLEAAEADHRRARVRAAYWVAELNRNKDLVERGVVTTSLFQQIQREHDATQQEELATKARLARAIAGPRAQEVEFAKAELRLQEHTVALANRQLEKADLKAPFRGRVEQRFVDVGAYVNVFPTGGVPVAHLVDLDQADALIAIPEVLRSQVDGQATVEIASAAMPEVRAVGKTVALGSIAEPATGTYEWRVRIPNANGLFTGGMVVNATLRHTSPQSVIQIPLTAVGRAYGQSPFVQLVDGEDQVRTRPVELGRVHDSMVEIVSGLDAGELLIVRGQQQVIEGDRVQVQRFLPFNTKDNSPPDDVAAEAAP